MTSENVVVRYFTVSDLSTLPGAAGRLPVLTFFSRYQDIFSWLLVLIVMR
jgi:hypothetical protein